MMKRCGFVFGGQQYDETVRFCVWGQQQDHFGDSGKEVIAGLAAPERCSAAWFCSGTEGNHQNLDGVGRSQDLPGAQ